MLTAQGCAGASWAGLLPMVEIGPARKLLRLLQWFGPGEATLAQMVFVTQNALAHRMALYSGIKSL